jgi:predicted DNA-binding transcriptional regulator AlpA
MHKEDSSKNIGFYSQKQFLDLVPVSVATLYNGISDGRFPQPVKLGGRSNFFYKAHVHALIEKGDWRLALPLNQE